MPVYYDLRDITDYESVCIIPSPTDTDGIVLNPITQTLIELSAWTGISKITPNNYKELAKRLAELELLGITYLSNSNPREKDVRNHIGLQTSVDVCDNKKWGNRVRNIIREQAEVLLNSFQEINV